MYPKLKVKSVSQGLNMQTLTKRQAEILNFIEQFVAAHNFPPSIREIAQHCKIISLNAVRKHLLKLEEKSLIDIASRQSRGISLPGVGTRIPVVGQIAAGQPILAWENIEEFIAVDRAFLENGQETFALKVKGDSMEPEIHEGDFVIVRRQTSAQPGDLVCALIGEEATVKVLKKISGSFFLHALNPKYRDIIFDGNTTICGKVIGLLRKF